MKTWTVAAVLFFLCTCGLAQTAQAPPTAPAARKPCEDLKAEIAQKLDAKGVVGYSLDIVDKGKEGDAKVIGSCGGGTKSITYARSGSVAEAKPAEEKKPQ